MKDRLGAYLSYEKEIDRLAERYERYRSKAEKMTSSWSDMPHGGTSPKDEIYAILLDIERESAGKIQELRQCEKEVEIIIESLPKPMWRIIMCDHYLRGMTWDAIAEAHHYTRRHVTRIHGWALHYLEMVWNKSE